MIITRWHPLLSRHELDALNFWGSCVCETSIKSGWRSESQVVTDLGVLLALRTLNAFKHLSLTGHDVSEAVCTERMATGQQSWLLVLLIAYTAFPFYLLKSTTRIESYSFLVTKL